MKFRISSGKEKDELAMTVSHIILSNLYSESKKNKVIWGWDNTIDKLTLNLEYIEPSLFFT